MQAKIMIALVLAGLSCAFVSVTGQAACAATSSSPGSSNQLRATLQRDLDSYLAARADVEHFSALSLSVILPGSSAPLNVVSGRTSRGGATPVRPENLYDIGSNTKAFIACVLLQLEAEGMLSIDDTVGRWLPQYPAWSGVSIRRLLDMTSGIPTYDANPAMERAQAASLKRRWTDPILVAFEDPVYGHEPGVTHGYSYSNTNYLLAGMIIERVTGHRYTDEVIRRLVRPLHLSDTFFSPNVYPKAVEDRLVSGYFVNDDPGNELLAPLFGRDVSRMDLSWAAAAGGMVATPEDVARWAQALYTNKVLAPPQQRELEQVVSTKSGKPIARVTSTDPAGFGLGVVQAVRPVIGTYWFYQGETLGNRMIYVWLPKSKAVYALGLNSSPSTRKGEHVGTLLLQIYGDLVRVGKIAPNGG